MTKIQKIVEAKLKIQKMLENQLLVLNKEIGRAQINESVEKIWRDMRKNKSSKRVDEEIGDKDDVIPKTSQKGMDSKETEEKMLADIIKVNAEMN